MEPADEANGTRIVEDRDPIVDAYAAIRPTMEVFTKKLEILFGELLEARKIDYHQIESRCKTINSFHEKCYRNGKSYRDPIREIKDLVGIRVVTYYLEDVERIAGIVRSEFDVDHEHSEATGKTLALDQFGYVSSHYIFSLDVNRATLTEWSAFRGLSAEIQIRTVLQHAWAAISHKLQYKIEESIPTSERRRLSRLSALLELADEQFSVLRQNTRSLQLDYRSNLREGRLNFEVNALSLVAYLESNGLGDQITRWGIDANWDPPLFSEDEIPPEAEHIHSFMRFWLLDEVQKAIPMLHAAGIYTIQTLNSLLEAAKSRSQEVLREVAEETRKLGFEPYSGPIDPLIVLVATEIKNDEVIRAIEELDWVTPGKVALERAVRRSRGEQVAPLDSIEADFVQRPRKRRRRLYAPFGSDDDPEPPASASDAPMPESRDELDDKSRFQPN